MRTWVNRGASGGLAGARRLKESNPRPIHLSQVKACSDKRSRLFSGRCAMGFTFVYLSLVLATECQYASFLACMTCAMRAVCILRSKGRSMEDLKDFEQYMAHLSEGLGHSDRHAGLRGYTTGLMSPLQRKSV